MSNLRLNELTKKYCQTISNSVTRNPKNRQLTT